MAPRSQRHNLDPLLLVLPAVAFLAAFFFSPALYNIWLSFQDLSLFQLTKAATFVGLRNFVELSGDSRFWLALWNTFFWLTAVTVAIRLALGLVLALLVNNPLLHRLRLAWLARSMLLVPWVTPPVVAVAAWQWLLHPRYGAVNQLLVSTGIAPDGVPFLVQTSTVWIAIVMIVVWREVPFVAVSYLAGLQGIPEELYESARVEGADRLQILLYITFPLLRPVTTVVTMLITIWTFNNFLYVWLATRGGPGNFTQVLATEMYTQAFTNFRLGYGAAWGMVMTLLMLAFSAVYFRRFFGRKPGDS
jgi:multiple sugar transport system permease protein